MATHQPQGDEEIRIIVTVSGGMVQEVTKPDDIVVEVHDYDTEMGGIDLVEDDEGIEYIRSIHH